MKTKKVNITPLNGYAVLRRVEEPKQTPGGILLPDNVKDKPKEGIVVAVGEGKVNEDGTRQDVPFKLGDKVMFNPFEGNEVKYEDEKLIFILQSDVLAVVNE